MTAQGTAVEWTVLEWSMLRFSYMQRQDFPGICVSLFSSLASSFSIYVRKNTWSCSWLDYGCFDISWNSIAVLDQNETNKLKKINYTICIQALFVSFRPRYLSDFVLTHNLSDLSISYILLFSFKYVIFCVFMRRWFVLSRRHKICRKNAVKMTAI